MPIYIAVEEECDFIEYRSIQSINDDKTFILVSF